MNSITGQILRRVGLVIEVLCMLGLLSVARGRVEFWQKHGIDPVIALRVGLGCGLIVWSIGSYIIIKSRRGSGR
jgi:hypothetical protein